MAWGRATKTYFFEEFTPDFEDDMISLGSGGEKGDQDGGSDNKPDLSPGRGRLRFHASLLVFSLLCSI